MPSGPSSKKFSATLADGTLHYTLDVTGSTPGDADMADGADDEEVVTEPAGDVALGAVNGEEAEESTNHGAAAQEDSAEPSATTRRKRAKPASAPTTPKLQSL